MKLLGRAAALAPLAAAVALAGSSTGQAGPTVVGGTGILVQSAPWAVYIRIAIGARTSFCSGTVVDAQHVLTAAHCVFDTNAQIVPVSTFTVRAGISSYTAPLGGDAEQTREVSSVRVHPGFTGPRSSSADDVAVLTLSTAFDLGGTAVQPVALPAPGAPFPDGAEVGFAGFGRQAPAQPPNGSLNWLEARVDEQGTCGDFGSSVVRAAAAVSLCAATPTASVCSGDSGAGLVTSAVPHTLVGVVSAGQVGCALGSQTIFTAVGPAEVLRFIQGDDAPPVAPRRTSATYVHLLWDSPLRPGSTVMCVSDRWDGAPYITYAFVRSDGQVLQQGPLGVFQLRARDVGDAVACRAIATNDGGTAVIQTDATDAVAPALRLGIVPIPPIDAVPGRAATLKVVLQAGRSAGKLGVCITPPTRVGGRVCASQLIGGSGVGTGIFPITLKLRIKPTAPLGTARLAVAAVGGDARAEATALVRVARG